MKYFMMSADKRGTYDPPGWDVTRQTPGRTEKKEEADVIFLVQNRHPEFKFNDALHDEMVGKPWVLFNWTENGWDWDQKETQFFGLNTEKFFGDGYNEDWRRFDQFVKDHPPLLTFQRELLAKDASERVLPLDYLNWLPEYGNDTKEDFLKRPIEVEFDWGRSSEVRPLLHGAIFQGVTQYGYDVVSEFCHLEHAIREGTKRIWLSVHTPWYARLDVRQLQGIVRRSLITVVLPGAGEKTFRLGERASDALMAIPEHKLASAYPWDSSNSITLPPARELATVNAVPFLADALMRTDLYELYCNAMGNAQNYRPEAYTRRHIAANVEKYL